MDANDAPSPSADFLASAESAIKRLEAPLDTSEEGLVNAFVYYLDIHSHMKTTIDILGGIDDLIVSGRPQIFGKDKWDNQAINLLELLNSLKSVIFGESIGESINTVPGGCQKIWFNHTKIFYESEKLTTNLMSFIKGNDSKGLVKAHSDMKSIFTFVNQLAKERDELLNIILHSGFDSDTIAHKAKQIRASRKNT